MARAFFNSLLVLNTTGNYNTATGIDALLSNTTGSQNTAEGVNALANGTSTNSNVAVGFNSLRNAQSNNNVAIGLNSGYGITTGTKNLLIGESSIAASYNQITTGSNNIAIGNDIAIASSTQSNQLNIGNFIYGIGLSGTGSTVSNAFIGFGNASPAYTLDVTGNGHFISYIDADHFVATSSSVASIFNGGFLSTASSTITSGLFSMNGGASTTNITASGIGFFGLGQFTNTTGTTTIAAGQGFTIGSSQFVLQQGSGNVGIGTASPKFQLHVNGGDASNVLFNGITKGIRFSSDSSGSTIAGVDNTGSASYAALSFTATVFPFNTGNVGIGLSAPASHLSIGGNMSAASWTTTGLNFGVNTNTLTDTSTTGNTTIATRAANSFGNPTFAFTKATSTITNAATLYIAGAPTADASSTIITNASALYVNSGNSYFGGNVGIGTTSPTTALQVNGAITPNADNTSSLGNSTYHWSAVYSTNKVIQTSDVRLKDNIATTTYGLDQVMHLRPVSFTWKAQPQQGTQLGFIAQEVQPILPETVNIGDDANHTLGLTYTEFIPVIVHAIQQLEQRITDFADSFTTKELTFTRATGDEIDVRKLCIGSTCVTEDQLKSVLASANAESGATPPPDSGSSASATPDTTLPVIMITGDNPAHINVGDRYADLGATVTDNVDQNLGLKYFLNGALVSNIVIDTSAAATDTIGYVATDNAGNTATSTRAVIIEAQALSALPVSNATTTAATSTSQ